MYADGEAYLLEHVSQRAERATSFYHRLIDQYGYRVTSLAELINDC